MDEDNGNDVEECVLFQTKQKIESTLRRPVYRRRHKSKNVGCGHNRMPGLARSGNGVIKLDEIRWTTNVAVPRDVQRACMYCLQSLRLLEQVIENVF